MSDEEQAAPARAGSTADLSRRMERVERRQDTIEGKVTELAAVVGRVEANQSHLIELNQLRFSSLDSGLKSLATNFEAFASRINSLISGESTTQQGARLMAEYEAFRSTTLARLEEHDKFETQGRLLARLAVILVSTNVIAIVVSVAAAVSAVAK